MTREAFDREARASRGFSADHFTEIPALIVACYDMGPWQSAGDPQRRWASPAVLFELGWRKRSAYMALQRRPIGVTDGGGERSTPACRTCSSPLARNGLGAVLTTWHLCFEQEFKQILGIPKRVKTFAAIPVGYPQGQFGPVRRRPAAEAIRWDRW